MYNIIRNYKNSFVANNKLGGEIPRAKLAL